MVEKHTTTIGGIGIEDIVVSVDADYRGQCFGKAVGVEETRDRTVADHSICHVRCFSLEKDSSDAVSIGASLMHSLRSPIEHADRRILHGSADDIRKATTDVLVCYREWFRVNVNPPSRADLLEDSSVLVVDLKHEGRVPDSVEVSIDKCRHGAFVPGEPGKPDSQCSTDSARCAVGTDDPGRPDLSGSVGTAERQRYAKLVLCQSGE